MNFDVTPFALAHLAPHAQTASAAAGAPPTASAAVDARHRKLTDAAQQFEGMLLEELLKPMREHSFGSGDTDSSGDDKDSSGFADTLTSFGSESLATAIARGGGLGIAKQVVRQVEGERAARHPPVAAH
jgi:Rod binding domain-containing protein